MHAGAVIVPAVLAAAEQEKLSGAAALLGIAVGVETICRLSLVVPKAVHKAGFHPTAVFGAMAAAAGVGAALQARRQRSSPTRWASPAPWPAASSSTWPTAAGPSACIRAGRRSRACAPRCWPAPASRARAPSSRARTACSTASPTRARATGARSLDGFGERWVDGDAGLQALSVRHHGPALHRLRAPAGMRGASSAEEIAEIVCEVGEGTVHRLWEPLADKQRPPNGYAAKFATPYCIAAAFLHGNLGLDAFTDAAVADPAVRALAAKVRYRIDPANPYPNAYTGHIRAHAADGRIARGAPAASARRRAGAALARRAGGEVRPQCARRRLAGGADRRGGGAGAGAVGQRPRRSHDVARLGLKTEPRGRRKLEPSTRNRQRRARHGDTARASTASPSRPGGGRPIRSWGPSIP